MESNIIHLHKAIDAEDSYAICLNDDPRETWRAERGFGQRFEKVWSVELQSKAKPRVPAVNWEAVLDRAIQACSLSDPVVSNFTWPHHQIA